MKLPPHMLYALATIWLASMGLYFVLPSTTTVATNEIAQLDQVLPKTQLRRPPYADWVHSHWVRLAPRASHRDAMHAIKEYQTMGVPIDAIVLQQWEHPQEPFLPDVAIFPDFKGFVALLHKLNIRVVLTVDTGLTKGSAHYATGVAKNYLLEGGKTITTKTRAEKGLVDYTNPDAVKWLHGLLTKLLTFQIDGVKVTALDAFFLEQWPIGGVKATNGQLIDSETWGQLYYYDTFDFGREVAGFDFVSMFRPVDSFGGFQYRSFGPQDISFAGWVGDHAISMEGLRESLLNAFHSANRGYVSFGISVGGAASETPPQAMPSTAVAHQELFLRWTQLAAFLPLMENGGQGENHYPWALHKVLSETVVQTYKTYAFLHKELRPYFYALASLSHIELLQRGGKAPDASAATPPTRVMNPLATNVFLSEPNAWDFLVGTDVFVAPILTNHSAANTAAAGGETKLESIVAQHNVTFPSYGLWIPYHYDRRHVGFYTPKSTVELAFTIAEYPVYKRRGCVLPLHVTSGETGNGAVESAEATTFVIDRPYLLKKRVMQKAVPPGLVLPDGDGGLEFAYAFQEHGHGVAAYYTTAASPTGEGHFTVHLRVTPFVTPIIVAIRGVRCAAASRSACSGLLIHSGYHAFTEKAAFFSGIRGNGLRAFLVTDDEMWLYDPFASIGNDVTLGPMVAI